MTRCSVCRQAGSEPAVLVLGGFPSTCAHAAAQTPALLQGTKALPRLGPAVDRRFLVAEEPLAEKGTVCNWAELCQLFPACMAFDLQQRSSPGDTAH